MAARDWTLSDVWIGRFAKPSPPALSAVAGLRPAAVVTGGSRGIGLALARRFAQAGATVALVARDAAALDRAAASLRSETGAPILVVPLDVCNHDAALALDLSLVKAGCYLDVLVNNAGIGMSGPFAGQPVDDMDRLVTLNMAAPTRLMRHALPGMLARGRGGILNIASLGGIVPGPHQAAYYASKAYLVSLTEAVAAENAGRGVRICVVAPGPVATDFHAGMGAENALYRRLLPAMTPEAVARSAYRGYRLGRHVVVPGVLNTLMAVALRVLPHTVTVPIVSWLLAPVASPDPEPPTS